MKDSVTLSLSKCDVSFLNHCERSDESFIFLYSFYLHLYYLCKKILRAIIVVTIKSGNKYNYKLLLYSIGEEYQFSIKAIEKETKRTSFITTINVLLNELNINSQNNRFWESEWLINKKELKIFFKKINKLFIDDSFLSYLENYLDQDRTEGEWETIEA